MRTGRSGHRWLAATGLSLMAAVAAQAGCPPEAAPREELLALKAAKFELEDDGLRQRLALDLLDCLGDPEPLLRDGVAFEALSTWMRAGRLSSDTRARLLEALLPRLAAGDPEGLAAPFAALVLAEVARTDRIEPWMDARQRLAIAAGAADYLAGVSDYRGFVDGEGWRHGVAHGADLVLQLAMNPRLDAAELAKLRFAVGVQVAPAAGHAYVHGESMRLARASFAIAGRDAFDAADWLEWLAAVAAPAPLPDWSEAFNSEAGLARRHDVSAFLSALYLLAREGGDAAAEERLMPGLKAALRRVP